MKTPTLIICLLLSAACKAQVLTLQQCIDTALRRNIPLRDVRLASEAADRNADIAKASMMPNLYGSVNQGINFGRNVDPFTNDYVQRTIDFGSYGLSSSVTLFSGNSIRNNVKQQQLEANASKLDIETVRQQTRLNVTLAYLQVLSTAEQLEAVRKQAVASEEQLKRLELRKKKGVTAASQVSDLQGQLQNDQLAIVDLQNTLEWYKMELAQHMNVPYNKDIRLQPVNVEGMTKTTSQGAGNVYRRALGVLPQVRAAQLRSESAAYRWRSAKGLRYPQVIAGGTVQTVYASSARIANDKVAFGDQFWNNRFATLNLGIRIPIFTGGAIRNQIKLADVQRRRTALAEEANRTEIWRQIERADVAMVNARQKFQALQTQISAYEVSYEAAEARFVTGVDGSLNYLLAKNNLDRARQNMIIAKYDLALKQQVLEYYSNGDW
jgi:outer membrane protein